MEGTDRAANAPSYLLVASESEHRRRRSMIDRRSHIVCFGPLSPPTPGAITLALSEFFPPMLSPFMMPQPTLAVRARNGRRGRDAKDCQ